MDSLGWVVWVEWKCELVVAMGGVGSVGLKNFRVGRKGGVGRYFGMVDVDSVGTKNFSVDKENGVGLNILLFNHPL